jgi:hypothetical protein
MVKPGVEVKAEKSAPVAPSAVKAPEKTTVENKTDKSATTGKEMEKVTSPKPNPEVKPDKAPGPQSSVGQSTDKTAAAKSVADAKPEKANTSKPAGDKAPAKSEEVKNPVKQ